MISDATFLTLVSGLFGATLKALWDAYVGKKKEIEVQSWKLKAQELEKKLSSFYWPIYIRLQRDNVVWEKILHKNHKDCHIEKNLAYEIEKGVLIPNHEEVIKLIEKNIYLSSMDNEMEEQILSYMRHVDIYKSLKSLGIEDVEPKDVGEAYPVGLFSIIEKRLFAYQKEYEELLRKN